MRRKQSATLTEVSPRSLYFIVVVMVIGMGRIRKEMNVGQLVAWQEGTREERCLMDMAGK